MGDTDAAVRSPLAIAIVAETTEKNLPEFASKIKSVEF